MRRLLITTTCAALLVGMTATVTARMVAQDDEQQHADMMEHWMKLAQPGPEHERLAQMAGEWTFHNTYWEYPGAEPQTTVSEASIESVMGGRYMIERVKGTHEMNGVEMDFEGMCIFGYDNAKQKHVYAWIDNMGTMIMTGEGAVDATGKVITYETSMPDPSGGEMEMKLVTRIVNDDEWKMEMHARMPDDSWFQNMEITSQRK